MDVGNFVGDSFDFEVSPLHVDRSLRSSYNNNIMNNKTGYFLITFTDRARYVIIRLR